MLPSSMSSPNGATLTPSLTSSSHNSASPNNSGNTNEDGNLLIDEDPDQIRSDQNDDDSIEDVLKKEREREMVKNLESRGAIPQTSTPNAAHALPQIPKDLAQHIQLATKTLAKQQAQRLLGNQGSYKNQGILISLTIFDIY